MIAMTVALLAQRQVLFDLVLEKFQVDNAD